MIVTSTISPSLEFGLRLLGVWPDVSHLTVNIYMLCILIVLFFQYLYVSTRLKLSELSNLVDSLMTVLVSSLVFLKLASLRTRRRVIQEVLIAMDNDWRECIDTEQHLSVMTNKVNLSYFWSNALLSYNTIAGMLYILGDYAIHAMHLVGDYNDTFRQFPIKVQFPFESDKSPIFEFLVLILFLFEMVHSFTIAIVNGLISSLVLHICGQIDVICQEFKIDSKEMSVYKSSESTLRFLIKRHKRIILFSDNIEKLFSLIALMQVVWNSLIICCLGFIIIISLYNETGVFMIVKAFLAYFGLMLELFILCFAGEYLSFKSKLITDAAYNMLWYDMPSKHGKIIMFIIMRSQKQLTMTAGNFVNLSLGTFTNITKSSLSFISVLHAMY